MRLFLAFLLGFLACLQPAEARMHAPYRGHRIIPADAAPLDTFTQPSGAYSFRKLKSTYSGPGVRIRRASDNAELDINFLGFVPGLGSPWDEAAAASHCAATTCTVVTWYDQSGNARHLTQATPANQPALVLGCMNSLACIRLTATTQTLASAGTTTPATGVVTLSGVSSRTVGTGSCQILNQNQGNNLRHRNLAAGYAIVGGGGGLTVVGGTDGPHAVVGIVNGASSTIQTETMAVQTGTSTGNTVAGVTSVSGLTGSTCSTVEAIGWDNYNMPAGERDVLLANQRSFWGF